MGKILEKILGKLGFSTAGLGLGNKEKMEEFFKNLDISDLKACDKHGYSICEVAKLARDSEQEFPVKEECECRKFYDEVKKQHEEFKEKYQR